MKKIPSVFKRDYEGTRYVFDEVVPSCEWVLAGEGVATVKWDGTCCLIDGYGGQWKRHNRKPTKEARKRGKPYQSADDFKPAPEGWEAAEDAPNLHTGHWPGWLMVRDGPEDRWFRAAYGGQSMEPGTYELVGLKVQGNPHGLERHELWRHGSKLVAETAGPRLFAGIRNWLDSNAHAEGVVFHHPDGRMAKIKRKDFGFPWPPNGA